MSMTVGELLDILERLDENAEVRVARQPNWPFEYEIGDVAPIKPEDQHEGMVVYLVDGRPLGYLPGEAARQIGWRD